MEDSYSPRRFQTRLTRKTVDSKTVDTFSDNMGSTSSYFDIPMDKESTSRIPIERVWTHTSYVLGSSKSKATDQILLDQLSLSAEEVRDTKAFENRFLYFRGPLTNYNSIRETHRIQKETKREKALSTFEQVYRSPIVFVSKLILAIRAFFKSTRRILIGTVLDFLFDLVFCLSYIVEVQDNLGHIPYLNTITMPVGFPQYLKVYRSDGLFTFIFVCALWNLLSWLIRITYSSDKLKAFFTWSTFLDLFISVPVMVFYFISIGKYVYVPYFLRIFVLVRRFDEFLILKSTLGNVLPMPLSYVFSKESYGYAEERLYVIIARMLGLVYLSLCAFQYAEFNFGDEAHLSTLSLMDSFYFIIITMSTVGYGDITPTNTAAKLIVICTIAIALGILPGLISALIEIISGRTGGEGTFISKSGKPFIIVCGKFTSADELSDILNEFYWRKTTQNHAYRIVFLSSVPANSSIKSVINQNLLRDAISFFHGSALQESDLSRVKLQYASAAFIIPDKTNRNLKSEADKIVLRTLAFDNYSPETPLYVYNVLPETSSLQEKISAASICLESFKQMLLAYSCIYRGSSTFLINLLRQTAFQEIYDEPWKAQYGDGMDNAIFTCSINPVFVGKMFSEVSNILYHEYQVIFFSVSTQIRDRKHLILNPGGNYMLRATDEMFFIASNHQDVQLILNLSDEKVGRFYENYPKCTMPKLNSDSSKIAAIEFEDFMISVPKTACRIRGSLPLCKLLKEPPKLEEIIVQDASHWNDHILLCTRSFNIVIFLSTLRSMSISIEEYKVVLVLCESLPNAEEASEILQFPSVYLITGDSRRKQDLIRAGIHGVDKIVLLNLGSSVDLDDEAGVYADSNTIMVSHLIHSMFVGANKKYVINDLQEKENIKFLRPTSLKYKKRKILRRDRIPYAKKDFFEDSFSFTPIFSTGRVISSGMMAPILYQSYFNPFITHIFRFMCGVYTVEEAELDKEFNMKSRSLSYISVPVQFVGLSFGEYFEDLNLRYGILAIGLYRDEIHPDLQNRLPFVYTNPLRSLILKKTDLIYVIADDSQI